MKFLLILFLFRWASAAPTLNLKVVDQNFNSTDKIIIDQAEIQNAHFSNLADLLQSKANISVTANNMQPRSIYIRGGDSSHVLVIIDGVPTYDTSTPQKTTNLFNLNISQIKRLTILKGSQSVIYGGQALSGVILIETFTDDQSDQNVVVADADFSREGGNRQSLSVESIKNLSDTVKLNGRLHAVNARQNSPVQNSDQLYPQKLGSADLAVQIKGDFENIFKLSYAKDDREINDSDLTTSKPVDTDDFQVLTDATGLAWIFRRPQSFTLTSSTQKLLRTFNQPIFGLQKYEGVLSNIRLDGHLWSNEKSSFDGGLQLSTESMKSSIPGVNDFEAQTQYEGVYFKADHRYSSGLFFEYGFRYESKKLNSFASSHHMGFGWDETIKFEYSTGFKTPSLFQLYAPIFGNADLESEKAKNFSVLLEHQFNDHYYASLTYFDSQFENLIDFSFTANTYNNILLARTTGVELQNNFNFYDGAFRIYLGLGYQEPRDVSQDQWLTRRSLHSGSLKLAGDLIEQLDLGIETIYVGEKLDKAGPAYVTIKDYVVNNIFGNYKISSTAKAFIRVDNIEGKEYETSYGYFNQGVIYKIGTQITF